MDSQEPAATFVSKIQLISEFVKELFHNDDFKEERATIYIMVSLTLHIFRRRTFCKPIIVTVGKEKINFFYSSRKNFNSVKYKILKGIF